MSLLELIRESGEEIEHTSRSFLNKRAQVNGKTAERVNEVLARKSNFEYWCELLESRSNALSNIRNMHTMVGQDGNIPFGSGSVSLSEARLMMTQSYLSLNWSISDNISEYFGKVFCIPKNAYNPKYSVQLVSDIISGKSAEGTAALICTSVKNEYGWPIAISSVLRNHFVHDGGIFVSGTKFFEHGSPANWFAISPSVWQEVLDELEKRDHATSACVKPGRELPSSAESDLRELLLYCESSMDEALSMIFQLTNNALQTQVATLIGE